MSDCDVSAMEEYMAQPYRARIVMGKGCPGTSGKHVVEFDDEDSDGWCCQCGQEFIIDEMEAGEDIDLLVTMLMEPIPAQISAKALREKERMTEWYSNHYAFSPKRWWRAEIGTSHNQDKNGRFCIEKDNDPVEWLPAREPSSDIAAVWPIAESLRAFSVCRDQIGHWQAWAWSRTHLGSVAETAPLAICRTAIKAKRNPPPRD